MIIDSVYSCEQSESEGMATLSAEICVMSVRLALMRTGWHSDTAQYKVMLWSGDYWRGVDAMWDVDVQTWVVWEDLWYFCKYFDSTWSVLARKIAHSACKVGRWGPTLKEMSYQWNWGKGDSLSYPPKNVHQPEAAVQYNTLERTFKELVHTCILPLVSPLYKIAEYTSFKQNTRCAEKEYLSFWKQCPAHILGQKPYV